MENRTNTSKKNFIFKIIILGDCSVGKTSIIQNYIRKSISQVYKPTIGADFHSKKIEIKEGNDTKNVTLQIWDTAGQERFQSLGVAFYRGAEACVLVYDITNAKSFENLQIWKNDFLVKAGPKDPENFPFILFGNKVDLESERQVDKTEVEKWLKQNDGVIYEETSALSGQNVDEAFLAVGKKILSKQQNQNTTSDMPSKIGGGPSQSQGQQKFDLKKQKNTQNSKGGCCKM